MIDAYASYDMKIVLQQCEQTGSQRSLITCHKDLNHQNMEQQYYPITHSTSLKKSLLAQFIANRLAKVSPTF